MIALDTVFAWVPTAELIARMIYKSNSRIANKVKRVMRKHSSNKTATIETVEQDVELEEIRVLLQEAGIHDGDLLIVHTSMDGLKRVNTEPNKVLDMLIDLVGKNGTLVLPAFPKYKKNDRENVKRYDYNKALAWTGVIPNIFFRERGAKRSHLPQNTLAALGSHSKEMFEKETMAITTYGKDTPWEYCMEHHAKVLFLGVEPYHSISEAHIAEDLLFMDYPIKDWYEEQEYLIGTGDCFERKKYYIRKNIWSKYLIEHYHQRRLLKEGFIREVGKGKVTAFVMDDLEKYVTYMLKNISQKKDLVDFKIPKKFWSSETVVE